MSNVPSPHSVESRRRTRLRWIMGALGVVLLALIFWHVIGRKPPPKAEAAQTVKVAPAVRGDMPVILNELGTVTPTATVTVVPNQAVSGYLTEVSFREGQDVQKNQLLAQIDPRPYEVLMHQAEAQLAKDQAALDQARVDFERYSKLHQQRSIAEQTYIDQKFLVEQDAAAVKADQANIDQYALDIAYCRITAPVSGRVGLRQVDPGNYITGSSSTGLAVITTLKPTTVEFTVAQNDLEKVVERFSAPGVKLPVTVYNSDNSRPLATGTLYAINNQMNVSTGTVTLRASFPNDDEALYPNEFVNVRLLVDTLKQAILVPTPAVLNGAPGDYVYLVDAQGDSVSVRKVVLGPSDGKNTVVKEGLNDGDRVVIDGTDRLSDGAKIKIAEQPAAQASNAKGGRVPPPGQ